MNTDEALRYAEETKRLIAVAATPDERAIDVLAAEVLRLREVVANGDFKDVYAEGIEMGKRLMRTGFDNVSKALFASNADLKTIRAAADKFIQMYNYGNDEQTNDAFDALSNAAAERSES